MRSRRRFMRECSQWMPSLLSYHGYLLRLGVPGPRTPRPLDPGTELFSLSILTEGRSGAAQLPRGLAIWEGANHPRRPPAAVLLRQAAIEHASESSTNLVTEALRAALRPLASLFLGRSILRPLRGGLWR